MRRLVFPVLLILAFAPALQAGVQKHVTAAELERMLADSRDKQDADLAAQLSDLRLTARLSDSQLLHCLSTLSGPRSQRALLAIADRSAFLPADPSDTLSKPAPDLAEQRRIMGLAATYVTQTVGQLPRFVANRTITHFESATVDSGAVPDDFGSLQAVRLSRASVQYRDGEEIVESPIVKVSGKHAGDRGLRTWGVFGPILSLVLLDAAQNQLAWGHWEQGESGPLAVFHYSVSREKSHYQVRYCCVLSSYGMESNTFEEMSGYNGEIAVNPETGTILRLRLEANLQPNDPISRANLLVEYGPVDLGGQTYTLPSRSISISVARTIRAVQDPSGHGYNTMGPPQLLLNHADFDQYHLFRGESRVLSGNEERSAGFAPDATLPASQPGDAQPAEEILAQSPAAAMASASGSEAPEISAAAATSLPDTAEHPLQSPPDSQPSGFTLHINARLVDVNVVALDKKGRPITGLKQEDFEVYDNGVKQEVRSFNQADTPASSPASPSPAPIQSFTNRPQPETATGTPAGSPASGNIFVLVIDPANLIYTDMVDARRQMIDFVKQIPAGERVALYVMRYRTFQILQEATTDHAHVAAILSKWTPSAQDLNNARDEEDRNRQNLEYVHSPEDMLNVNGSYTLDPNTQQEALDPKLRTLGSNPAGNSLVILTEIAGHLAPMPGHKSVVWLTSDNALADWDRSSMSFDKHSKSIEPAALHTQEAMNNAHASVYPLDASRLNPNVINAEIYNRNVELTPTFQMPPLNEQAMEGPEMQAGMDANIYGQGRDMRPGRLMAQMEQDIKSIQGVFRQVAEATGGHAFRRSNNIQGELDSVEAESHATYLLGFSPSQPSDGQYHLLTVKLINHKDATVRYRNGYQYSKEPSTLKERFAQAVWEPTDAKEIAIDAKPVNDAAGQAIRVTVAGTDIDLTQQSLAAHAGMSAPVTAAQNGSGSPNPAGHEVWAGKLDIFLVQRDETGRKAQVTGQTVGLHLKSPTYQHAISDGLTFDQRIKPAPGMSSLRVIVVDVNSGRIGSVTVPASALAPLSSSVTVPASPTGAQSH